MGDQRKEQNQAEQGQAEKIPAPPKETPQDNKQPQQEKPVDEKRDGKRDEKRDRGKDGETQSPKDDDKGSETSFENGPIKDSLFMQGNNNNNNTLIDKIIANISTGDKNFEISDFSINDDSVSLPPKHLNLIDDYFVYPPGPVNELVDCLKEHHVLLLTGEEKSGKFLTAQYLCNQITRNGEKKYDVRRVDTLKPKKQIELPRLLNNKKELDGKILIFQDAFAKKNQDMVRFVESCSKEPILKEQDTYIIFTADTGTFDDYRIDGLKIKKNIFQLDDTLLRKGFDSNLKHFCSQSSKLDFLEMSRNLDTHKDDIIEQLKKMSNIRQFFENFLEDVISEKKPLNEAIEEVLSIEKHLKHWFLKELGMNKHDFETWTFTLCLAIFHLPIDQVIPYSILDTIHRDITMVLLEKLDPFKTLKEFTFTLSESELLEKCKAEIACDSELQADYAFFKDEDYFTELLKILLGNNRRVLLTLIPYLESYMENHYFSEERRLVAIGLARIGQLAPRTILEPLIAKWTDFEDGQWKNVGYLYEGIVDSKDEKYERYCMNILNQMAVSEYISEEQMDYSEYIARKWTAINAYKQIGLHKPEVAIEELRKIQQDTLKKEFENKETIRRFLYEETADVDEENVLKVLGKIYEETNVILKYIRFSITALSVSFFDEPIALNPIDVLDGLKQWIHNGNQNSRANVVLIFMGEDSILKALEKRDVIFPHEDQDGKVEQVRTNLLLYELAGGEEQVKKMTSFLIDLYNKCFPEFETDVIKELKKLLFDYLKKWIIDNLSYSIIINAIEELIVQLYNSGDDEFKDTLWDKINRWKAPKDKEKELDDFVDNVSKKIFNM